MSITEASALLRLLQLASPALPVGGYSYSEGLETLSQQGSLPNAAALEAWLTQELRYGMVRLETSIGLKGHQATARADTAAIAYWNDYLSALRETEELRNQSWQMGQSLKQLLVQLDSDFEPLLPSTPCNFAIAFAVAAAQWSLSPRETALGYLYSWMNTNISAGIKLIPLGQTAGQQIQQRLYPELEAASEAVLQHGQSEAGDSFEARFAQTTDLIPGEVCSWGLSLASMSHETLYSRLFRS
ncbi:MAG: urease accessory protein UreF [Elainellaceae cyanobacterium]